MSVTHCPTRSLLQTSLCAFPFFSSPSHPQLLQRSCSLWRPGHHAPASTHSHARCCGLILQDGWGGIHAGHCGSHAWLRTSRTGAVPRRPPFSALALRSQAPRLTPAGHPNPDPASSRPRSHLPFPCTPTPFLQCLPEPHLSPLASATPAHSPQVTWEPPYPQAWRALAHGCTRTMKFDSPSYLTCLCPEGALWPPVS